MPMKGRDMVDEHMVRKDENGYSLDHILVLDTSRSLIQELNEEIRVKNRILKAKQLQKNYRSNRNGITSKDIQSLMQTHIINKKDVLDDRDKGRVKRELIVYNDLHFFE